MIDQARWHIWIMRAAYVGLGVLIVLMQLMPLEFTPRRFALPDMVIALTLAWAVRRPEYVPALAVAAVLLLADFLLLRPPGLLAALVLGGAEFLKAQSRGLRDQPFAMEWLSVAILIVGIFVAFRLVAAIALVPQAPLALTLIQMVGTILAYPVVVLLSYAVLGLRKSAPGEVDTLGHRT